MNSYTDKDVRVDVDFSDTSGTSTFPSDRSQINAMETALIADSKFVPLVMTAPTRSSSSVTSSYDIVDDERQARVVRRSSTSDLSSKNGKQSNQALLHRLSLGVALILHDGNSAEGTPILLSVQGDHNHIRLTPIDRPSIDNDTRIHTSSPSSTSSWNAPTPPQPVVDNKNSTKDQSSESSFFIDNRVQYIPIRLVTCMDFGKTTKNFESDLLASLHPMLCFSISTEMSTYCFQARSSLERETIVAALMVILNEIHLNDVISAGQGSPYSQDHIMSKRKDNFRSNPSTPTPSPKKPYFLSPSQRTFIHDNRTGSSNAHEDQGTEASLAGSLEKGQVPVPFLPNPNERAEHKPSLQDEDTVVSKSSQASICVDSDVKINNPENEKWCDQLCTMTLQDITEAVSDMIHDIDEIKICGESISDVICGPYGIIVSGRDAKNQQVLEKNICAILSSTFRSESWFEGRVWSIFDVCAEKINFNEPVELRRVLRNRATVLNGQARRLKNLRDEMNFFYAVKSAGEKMSWIDITKSLDDGDIDFGTPIPLNYSVTSPSSATASYSFFSECSPPVIAGSTKMDESDDLFYDSDPGEIRVHQRGSRMGEKKIHEPVKQTVCEETTKNSLNGSHELPAVEQHHSVANGKVSKEDIELLQMKNESFTLVWHPTQSKRNKNQAPICVKAWIELGSRLRTRFVQPKFMWRAAYEPKLDKKVLNNSNQTPHSIELLDICRIVPATSINRNLHPFAKLVNSYTIETSDDIFMFEARNEKEKLRVTHGLKLIVSRLASKLIVGDEDVYDEFFTPGGSEVAGEPPSWARTIH